MKITWATVIAVVSGLAGVAGVVVTPLWGTALAGEVQAVLMAISGILVIVNGGAATTVALQPGCWCRGLTVTSIGPAGSPPCQTQLLTSNSLRSKSSAGPTMTRLLATSSSMT